MKKNRTIRTLCGLIGLAVLLQHSFQLAVRAQSDATAVQATTKEKQPISEAEQKLAEAIKRVEKLEWIQAGIRQTMNVGGRKFLATGRHLQGPELRLRRELNVAIGKTSSSILEICDGETLFLKQQIDESIDLKEVAVNDVLEAIDDAKLTDQRSRWLRELGLTNLGDYLRGLEQTHRFDTVEQGTWEGNAVFILHGRWKPEAVETVAIKPRRPDDAAGETDEEDPKPVILPATVPDEVICYLGADNGVPYKVVFQKVAPRGKRIDLAIIELTDVVIGQPIDQREFDYIAPTESVNLTDQFITRIQVEGIDSE